MLVRSRSDRSRALFHPFPLTIMPLPLPLALTTLSPPWLTPLVSPHPYCLPHVPVIPQTLHSAPNIMYPLPPPPFIFYHKYAFCM